MLTLFIPEKKTTDNNKQLSGDSIPAVEAITSSESDAARSSDCSPSDDETPPTPPTMTDTKNTNNRRVQWKKRKRGRFARVAHVQSTTTSSSSPRRSNHYQVTLRRRAVRKRDEASDDPSYGDISLGMKLSVLQGRVIVQDLNSLKDGRASPAQLTGLIQRGDILLQIDNKSLVDLPLQQLMEGLAPLSTPNAEGIYQQILDLQFAACEGLHLLETNQHQSPSQNPETGAAAPDVLSLFPIVDQLSGVALFEPHVPPALGSSPSRETAPKDEKDDEALASSNLSNSNEEKEPTEERISKSLALTIRLDRQRFTSEFYSNRTSRLLRAVEEEVKDNLSTQKSEDEDEEDELSLTQSVALERGKKAVLGAHKLSYQMETMDRGKDVRSFKTWASSISLRSRASNRRRFVLDSASLPSFFQRSSKPPPSAFQKNNKEIGSTSSSSGDDGSSQGEGSKSDDEVDGDELLLRLAAHDEIWREQVVGELTQAIANVETPASDCADTAASDKRTDEKREEDIDAAFSKELGTVLFGEVSTILKKQQKSNALPPDDITGVLFDLMTNLTLTMPDEVTMLGSIENLSGTLSMGFAGSHRSTAVKANIVLATRFILDEALPLWLKSFRPLQWDQRRVLWPVQKQHSGIMAGAMDYSLAGGGTTTNLSDDSLTIDSGETGQLSSMRKSKNLREIIEDQELNVETRAETCFLVSCYLTQQLLTKFSLLQKGSASIQSKKAFQEEIVGFVKQYGAYLRMDTSLAFAAKAEADAVIDVLLQVAAHDPRHQHALKETSRSSLILYDPTLLSAIISYLKKINEYNDSRRRTIVNLCVSAYPDVRPWQVRKACLGPPSNDEASNGNAGALEELFYTYLCQLLHPLQGHSDARQDTALVQEWCEMSVGVKAGSSRQADVAKTTEEKRMNFFCVASRTSSNHLAYRRDLVVLLELAAAIKEYSLALDLVGEILEHPKYMRSESVLRVVLEYLREMALHFVDLICDPQQRLDSFRSLKRVLRLFRKMFKNDSTEFRNVIEIHAELYSLLEHARKSPRGDVKVLDLIEFLGKESNPRDALRTLSRWFSVSEPNVIFIPILQVVLRRGVESSMSSELSVSLLRLDHARRSYGTNGLLLADSLQSPTNDNGKVAAADRSIWARMSSGLLPLDK